MLADPVLGAVRETGPRPGDRRSGRYEDSETGRECDRPERHENPGTFDQGELPFQILAAVSQLLRGRPVVRRRAARRGRDERPTQSQAVPGSRRLRPVGQPHGVQRAEKEVARLIAREDAAGPVPAVGRRRQAHDEKPRGRISERGDRTGPVGLPHEAPGRIPRNAFAPGHQPGTSAARDDLALERPKVFRHR